MGQTTSEVCGGEAVSPRTVHWERATMCFYQKQLLKDVLLQPTEELLLSVPAVGVCRGEAEEQAQTSHSLDRKTPNLALLTRTQSCWIPEVPNPSWSPVEGASALAAKLGVSTPSISCFTWELSLSPTLSSAAPYVLLLGVSLLRFLLFLPSSSSLEEKLLSKHFCSPA